MCPIVANDEAPPEIPAEAYERAAQIRALLHANLWEEEKARQIVAFDCGDMELQLAVGLLLKPAELRAWHSYFSAGYGMRSHQD